MTPPPFLVMTTVDERGVVIPSRFGQVLPPPGQMLLALRTRQHCLFPVYEVLITRILRHRLGGYTPAEGVIGAHQGAGEQDTGSAVEDDVMNGDQADMPLSRSMPARE